jgi:hypothetical protein
MHPSAGRGVQSASLGCEREMAQHPPRAENLRGGSTPPTGTIIQPIPCTQLINWNSRGYSRLVTMGGWAEILPKVPFFYSRHFSILLLLSRLQLSQRIANVGLRVSPDCRMRCSQSGGRSYRVP